MLYLLRHGETELNSAGRLQGRMDSALTDRGVQQAHILGGKLKSIIGSSEVTLWVSPLGRAQQTANIVETYLGLSDRRTDHRLAEIAIGDWEGMTMGDIEFTQPGLLDGNGRFDWAYRAPNGETERAFLDRLTDWVGAIETSDTVNVAISHGWAGLGLRSIYTGLPFDRVEANGDSHEAIFEFSNGAMRQV